MNFLETIGKSLFNTTTFLSDTVKDIFGGEDIVYEKAPEPEVAGINKKTEEPASTRRLASTDIKFQETQEGFRGMPYIEKDGGSQFLDEYDFQPQEGQQITSLQITDPRDATADEFSQQGTTITDPEQLKVFNTIKAVADEIAPEYTDYLLRLGWYEGRGKSDNRLDNGENGIDRGIFQINSKAFPDVPDEFADDPVKATMWAISAIEAGKQSRWEADKYVKNAKTNISYANE